MWTEIIEWFDRTAPPWQLWLLSVAMIALYWWVCETK